MRAGAISILHFLEGRKQFVVPIYQRTYSWTPKQCEQLWNDIVRTGDNPAIPAHFVGSVVYVQDGLYVAGGTQELLVIDGQQRLTTLALLLIALTRAVQDAPLPEFNSDLIRDEYLTNRHGEGTQHYKLLLTQSDRDTLISLIDNHPLPVQTSQRITENFDYFQRKIAAGADLRALYKGVAKLVVVEISLDRVQDNPQLIFESLNSTGIDLSQADLIRNYVLMDLELDMQADLYSRFWFPMEQLFGNHYSSDFDYYMRDYLTIASGSGSIPNIGKVYERFKAFREARRHSSIAEIVGDVYQYSLYYTRLRYQTDPDADVNVIMRDINTLEVDVAYPFLLELYADYDQHLLGRDDFLAVLRLVESYVFRRAICDIPTNSMNKTFATLTRDVDKTHYLSSVQAILRAKDSYRRFPDDDEFRRAFAARNIYDLTKRRSYLLAKLENYDHREPINVRDYTIEHVMPQNPNLSEEWQKMLGSNWQQVQSTYLHTIGNLTLTRYNPELSDRPFAVKRDMKGGFRDSHLRLNADLASLDLWNEHEITQRAQRLADLALKIWAFPLLPPGILIGANAPGSRVGVFAPDIDDEDDDA